MEAVVQPVIDEMSDRYGASVGTEKNAPKATCYHQK